MRKRRIIQVGQNFNRLTVIGLAGPEYHPELILKCKCLCGTVKIMKAVDVVYGRSKSCGCLKTESARRVIKLSHVINTTHGMSRTRIYKIWARMLSRCFNKNNTRFSSYGGRGITVCKRWLEFTNFYADMGDCPPGKTLDRFPDNDAGYKSSNCRWATPKQQQRNMRTTSFIKYRGRRHVLRDLCDRFGQDADTVRTRLKRGWGTARALEQKPTWTRKIQKRGEKKAAT